jgi:hypothetical protein
MKLRIFIDLGDSYLMRLMKLESQQTGLSLKSIIILALENYFAYRLEIKAFQKLSEEAFKDWEDPRDREYDKL